MQHNVQQAISGRRIAPEMVFQPERAVKQRIVLLCGTEIEPYAPQPLKGLESRPREVGIIVPQHSATDGWPVGNQYSYKQQRNQPDLSVVFVLCDRRHSGRKNSMELGNSEEIQPQKRHKIHQRLL